MLCHRMVVNLLFWNALAPDAKSGIIARWIRLKFNHCRGNLTAMPLMEPSPWTTRPYITQTPENGCPPSASKGIRDRILMPNNRSIIFKELSTVKHESPVLLLTPDDNAFPKRVDSLWKIWAQVSAAGGVENTVTNAVSIRLVNSQIGIKPFDPLATFIRP